MSTQEYSACVKGKLKCADSHLAKVFKEEKAAKKAAKAAKKAKKEQKKLQEKIDKANEKKNYKKLGKLEKEMKKLKKEHAAEFGKVLSQDSTSSSKSTEEDPYRFLTPSQKRKAMLEEQKELDKIARGEVLTHKEKVDQMNEKLLHFNADGDIPKCQENLRCKYEEGYLQSSFKH